VGVADPVQRLRAVSGAMRNVKESGQAIAARALTELAGFAPPTVVAQAARLQTRQRLFNLVVTNVPGPQTPLYLLGRKLQTIYPMVPLAENTAIGIAVMSYNGGLGFGVVGDYDVLEDLERVADAIRVSIEELAAAAARTVQLPGAGTIATGAEAAPAEADRPRVGVTPSSS
jgi:hypothetical protein